MTTIETKKIERPEGVPIHCERCSTGSVVFHEDYTTHGLVGEWRCSTCEKIYLPKSERQKYMDLNYNDILKDLVELGYTGTLKKHPVKPVELKELKIKHAKLLGKLRRQFDKDERIRVSREINPIPQNLRGNHPGLPEWKDEWDKEVQLKWLEIRGEEISAEIKKSDALAR